jgi:hypothetical protein
MQIGLFTVILTVTAAVIVMMILYNLTIEKTHDLAVLKLMGAPGSRLLGLVLQQAWLLGALGYVVAYALGELAYPIFPRRVVITETIRIVAPLATFAIVTLASALGLGHVMRIDPAKALEGWFLENPQWFDPAGAVPGEAADQSTAAPQPRVVSGATAGAAPAAVTSAPLAAPEPGAPVQRPLSRPPELVPTIE